MIKNSIDQYATLDAITRALCRDAGVSFLALCSNRKNKKLNTLRGVYCVLSRDYSVHPIRAAKMICRSRQNIINQARKYLGLIQVKDPLVLSVYNNVRNQLTVSHYDADIRIK